MLHGETVNDSVFTHTAQYSRTVQFYRATETVVKAQTWIVRSVDALIAIVKTRLQLAPSLCGLLLARSLGHDERRKSSRRQTTKVL